MNKKELVVKFRPLVSLACRVHNSGNVFRMKLKGKNNRIIAPCALLKKFNVHINGDNNTVLIGDWCVLNEASVYIYGSDNVITIGDWCHLAGTELCIEDSGNRIEIGSKTEILGKTHLAAIEGTKISIGSDCLFSSDIHFRTGDSHSVLDMDGRRINASEDITIGNHVWVGTKVLCLKGATVGDRSIIGAGALATRSFTEPNCSLAGVPAKVVRTNVDWSIRRIPLGEIAEDFCGVV